MSMHAKFKGEEFDSSLTVAEICAKIRARLKSDFPDCKFSVRKRRYNALDVALISGNFDLFQPGAKITSRQLISSASGLCFAPRAEEVLNGAIEIINRWRRYDSDFMTDYFDTNFYYLVIADEDDYKRRA